MLNALAVICQEYGVGEKMILNHDPAGRAKSSEDAPNRTSRRETYTIQKECCAIKDDSFESELSLSVARRYLYVDASFTRSFIKCIQNRLSSAAAGFMRLYVRSVFIPPMGVYLSLSWRKGH